MRVRSDIGLGCKKKKKKIHFFFLQKLNCINFLRGKNFHGSFKIGREIVERTVRYKRTCPEYDVSDIIKNFNPSGVLPVLCALNCSIPHGAIQHVCPWSAAHHAQLVLRA